MLTGQYRIEPTPDVQKQASAIADEILGPLKSKGLSVETVFYALELAIRKVNGTTFTGVSPCGESREEIKGWAAKLLKEADP